MEGNYVTAGELALYDRRGYGGYGYDCYHKRGNATATTGVALGAGLGGAALIGALVIGWGINQASKARSRAAEKLAESNAKNIDQLAALTIAERNSRENWQIANAPTIRQYVDVQTGAGAFSGASSNALATAIAQNSGINSAIGGCNFLRVARYSAPRPCGCDSCDE